MFNDCSRCQVSISQKGEAHCALKIAFTKQCTEKDELIAVIQSENEELKAEIAELREAAAARRSDGANVSVYLILFQVDDRSMSDPPSNLTIAATAYR